jgi:hypothetical protein
MIFVVAMIRAMVVDALVGPVKHAILDGMARTGAAAVDICPAPAAALAVRATPTVLVPLILVPAVLVPAVLVTTVVPAAATAAASATAATTSAVAAAMVLGHDDGAARPRFRPGGSQAGEGDGKDTESREEPGCPH